MHQGQGLTYNQGVILPPNSRNSSMNLGDNILAASYKGHRFPQLTSTFEPVSPLSNAFAQDTYSKLTANQTTRPKRNETRLETRKQQNEFDYSPKKNAKSIIKKKRSQH